MGFHIKLQFEKNTQPIKSSFNSMKKVLILGGTSFIGRNLVEVLLKRRDLEITLFNRQKTGVDLFPEVNKIKGDRETKDIEQISTQKWDVIIDVSCFYPADLRSVLGYLKTKPTKYIFISTCSVFDTTENNQPYKQESFPTQLCSESEATDRTVNTYGNRKAECERIVMQSGLEYIIFRPALVYGQYDPTDRFYYWLYQVAKNDPILIPDNGERKFSVTYVQDLVKLISTAINTSKTGVYNAISTVETSIDQIVSETEHILNKKAKRINARHSFLKQNNINQWVDMPLWIDNDNFTFLNNKTKADFNFEPIDFKTSVKKTIQYYEALNWPNPTYGIEESNRVSLIHELS